MTLRNAKKTPKRPAKKAAAKTSRKPSVKRPVLEFTQNEWGAYTSARGYQKRRCTLTAKADTKLHGIANRSFLVKEEPVLSSTGRKIGAIYYVPGSVYYFAESMEELKKVIQYAFQLQLKCSAWREKVGELKQAA